MPEFLTEWGLKNRVSQQAGIDRGMMYLPRPSGQLSRHWGMAWDGLIAVTKTPTGGDLTSYYYDGLKYLDWRDGADFEGTIQAFGFPDVSTYINGTNATFNAPFETPDGEFVKNGMVFTNQRPISFSMSWRTFRRFANGAVQEELHLLYNVMATPPEEVFGTVTDTPEPAILSWNIKAAPPDIHLYDITPTAHFIIRTREISAADRLWIEQRLYGTADANGNVIITPDLPLIRSLTDRLNIKNNPETPQYTIP